MSGVAAICASFAYLEALVDTFVAFSCNSVALIARYTGERFFPTKFGATLMTTISPVRTLPTAATVVDRPTPNANVGKASGGGFFDSIKSMFGFGSSKVKGGGDGDGSVGVADGVMGKSLIGSLVGGVAGFFIGGPVGAMAGAALVGGGTGLFFGFQNKKKMDNIRAENEALLSQIGITSDDPAVQQVLQSGQVQQLIPMAQAEMQGGVQQGGVQQGVPQTQQVPTTMVTQQYGGGDQDVNAQSTASLQPGESSANAGAVMSATQASATLSTDTDTQTQSVPLLAGGISPQDTLQQLEAQIAQLQAQIAEIQAALQS